MTGSFLSETTSSFKNNNKGYGIIALCCFLWIGGCATTSDPTPDSTPPTTRSSKAAKPTTSPEPIKLPESEIITAKKSNTDSRSRGIPSSAKKAKPTPVTTQSDDAYETSVSTDNIQNTIRVGQPNIIQEKRVALVIGNSNYLTSPLRNPANDAKAVTATLKSLDFEVISGVDLTAKEMKKQINEFGKRIRNGGVGLFYFAGHGLQVNGRNYLVPVDAKIESESDVDIESVRADEVLAKMDNAKNRLNIVILDACRNNPFARSFRSSSQGLATMDSPSGTLIAYATAPGSVASDGTGQNGLYTESLIEKMKIPDLKIEDMFKKVRSTVKNKTDGKQVPWESSSLEGDFYFGSSAILVAKKMEALSKKQNELNAELKEIEILEAAARKASNKQEKMDTELKKKAILAKIKVEELRKSQLEEQQRKLQEDEKSRRQQAASLMKQKEEESLRLNILRSRVQDKRKSLKGKTLASLSPEMTVSEMRKTANKINSIKEDFIKDFKAGVYSIISRLNKSFLGINKERKDEFETNNKFNKRIQQTRDKLEKEQTEDIARLRDKTINEYNNSIQPFISNIKKLSETSFTFTDKLNFKVGEYLIEDNEFPISIKGHVKNIPITNVSLLSLPRKEAKEFKTNYMNGLLRYKIKGMFKTTNSFIINEAVIIDDTINRHHNILASNIKRQTEPDTSINNLFSERFFVIQPGVVYDIVTNIIWMQRPIRKKRVSEKDYYWHRQNMYWRKVTETCKHLETSGIVGWRLLGAKEALEMQDVFQDKIKHPFINIRDKNSNRPWGGYYTIGNACKDETGPDRHSCVSLSEGGEYCCSDLKGGTPAWCVRGHSDHYDNEGV